MNGHDIDYSLMSRFFDISFIFFSVLTKFVRIVWKKLEDFPNLTTVNRYVSVPSHTGLVSILKDQSGLGSIVLIIKAKFL